MKFYQARIGGLSAVAVSMLLAACQVTATGQVTPGTATGSASPAASGSPAATSSVRPSASPGATTSASPTTSTSASPSASPSATATVKPSPTPTPAATTVQEAEPNNDFDTAQAVTPNVIVNGTMAEDDESGDYFKVTIPAGDQDGWLKISIDEKNDSWGPRTEIFGSDKAYLDAEGASSGTTNPVPSVYAVKAGGTYYIKIGEDGGAAGAAYKMTMDFVPVADENERNEDFDSATILTSGETTSFATFWAIDDEDEDIDTYKIDVPAGKTKIRVQIANKSTSALPASYRVELHGANKAYLDAAATPSGQADLDETFEVETAGTYYLKLTGSNVDVLSDLTVTVQ